MKTYYCHRLHDEINFDAEGIYTCCGPQLGACFPLPTKTTKMDEYVKQLEEWKCLIAKNSFLGKIPEECNYCMDLKFKNISCFEYLKNKFFFNKNSAKIKNIVIKSFRHCDLSCAYCIEKRYTKGKKTKITQKSEFYDVLPLLKALEKANLIDNEHFKIEFQGGSIHVWDEFIPTLNEIVSYKPETITYHSNATTFCQEIATYATNIQSNIMIAVDAGCAQTYAKIKGEDIFPVVVENIIKYADAGLNCIIKYIMVKNLNDNMDEVSKFMELIKEMKSRIKNPYRIVVMVTVDYRESLNSCYDIPTRYVELIEYMSDYCNQNKYELKIDDFIKRAMDEK